MTDFSIELEEDKLRLIRCIRNNLAYEKIQEVIGWKDERITDCYDSVGYCKLCAEILNTYLDNKDYGSSWAHHEMCKFISDMILIIAEQNKEQQLQIKKDKIKQLREEARGLTKEIKEQS